MDSNSKIAVVFPGQGSQRPGMGKDFVEQFSESREVFEKASDCLKIDMFNLCFEDEVRLNQTEFMQPAILTVEIAMLKAFEKVYGLSPDYYAGHSMGEYTALVAAGVFTFEDGINLVNGRSALMQNSVGEGKGAMSAIIMPGLSEVNLDPILKEYNIEIANKNSLSQSVIAGMRVDVDKATLALQNEFPAMRIVDLGIGLPFHSSKMQSVEPELLKYIETFLPRMDLAKSSKVLSNLTAVFHKPETMLQDLTKQISGCVEWCLNMDLLCKVAGNIIELGPYRVLGKFFKEAGREIHSVYSVKSLMRAKGS